MAPIKIPIIEEEMVRKNAKIIEENQAKLLEANKKIIENHDKILKEKYKDYPSNSSIDHFFKLSKEKILFSLKCFERFTIFSPSMILCLPLLDPINFQLNKFFYKNIEHLQLDWIKRLATEQ